MKKNKFWGLLGICAKAGKLVSGADIVEETILKHKAKLLVIAEDASEKTKKHFIYLCDKKHVSYLIFGTIQENSKAIGKNNRAIICVKDINFAKELKKIIDGGDVIGENENS